MTGIGRWPRARERRPFLCRWVLTAEMIALSAGVPDTYRETTASLGITNTKSWDFEKDQT